MAERNRPEDEEQISDVADDEVNGLDDDDLDDDDVDEDDDEEEDVDETEAD